jgi:uncharacterized protein DUF4229
MSPAVKYTLGRLGLFVVVFALLLPVPLNFLVKAMIALIASAAFSYFLLAKWRNEMAEQLGTVAERRKAEKDRLRAALAGDEAAAAEGDRLATSDAKSATAPESDRVASSDAMSAAAPEADHAADVAAPADKADKTG